MAQLHDAGAVLRRKGLVQGQPQGSCGGELRHLAEDVLGHGCKEGDHDQLILLVPAQVGRIGDLTGVVALSLEDGRGGRGKSAVNIPEELLCSKYWDGLSFPQEEIVTSKADGDEIGDGGD